MKKKVIFIIIIIFIFTLLFFDNSFKQQLIPDDGKTFIKTSALSIAKNLVISQGINDFKKYGESLNTTPLIDDCTQKILNNIKNKNNTVKLINTKLGPDDWAIMGYDNFVENLDKLNTNSDIKTTLNYEINKIKIASNINYDKIYNKNNIYFPNIIGPYDKKTNQEISTALRKIILEYINNDINDFINNFNSNLLMPNLDTFINNYINSDPYYKDNFGKFSEEKLKPYIITELSKIIITIYNKKIEDIRIFLSTQNGFININKILCKDLGGLFVNNNCSFALKEDCYNIYKWPLTDPSFNIFTSYNNNKCYSSVQSGLRKLVENNTNKNDIIYDFENEKAIITDQYCIKNGLEPTVDYEGNKDCKITNNKPILESILGSKLLDTINTKYDSAQYETCDINEIDGKGTIPDNLKTLLNPLIKKYGPIEKSLCIDKDFGCPINKELVNGVCYNKCQDGYVTNPNKLNECYKLYANFENNGELKNADIVTRKNINVVCPQGYSYNTTEKKCIENCPTNYTYNNNDCKSIIPTKWDGAKDEGKLTKNAIWSKSQVRVFKCLNTNKPEYIDGLCYAKCPPGHVHVPGAPYTCRPEPCPDGYSNTGVTCYRAPDTKLAWYTKDAAISRWVCPDNYTNNSGICWTNSCPSGSYTTTAGMCMDNCAPGYNNVVGVCYKCPDGFTIDVGALCRKQCNSGYRDVAGVCWQDCPSGYIDDGAFCRRDAHIYGKGCCCAYGSCCSGNCPSDYAEDPCTCRKDAHIFAKDSYVPETKAKESYVPQSNPLPSTPASCPSDRDNIDGLCYPKCNTNYWSSSPTTCETNICPDTYYKTIAATCQRNADTKTNPFIGAGDVASLVCPDGTTEASPGGICYPNNPPTGYQRHPISLEQWTEKCPDEWTDTGWFCNRNTKLVDKKNVTCQTDYIFQNDKCRQKCPENTINNTDTTCGREKTIRIDNLTELPYKYRIKKRITDYLSKI